MTEPSPTPEHDAAEERVHTPAPTPDTEDKEPKKTTTKKDFPVGQVAAGGLGAVTLGSYALASVVGPAGWLAAPAAGAVAGAGYVAYRRRKSRSGVERTKTTITRTRGSKTMRGGGLLRSRGGGRSGLGSVGRAGAGLGGDSRGGAAVRRAGGGTAPRLGGSGRRTSGGGGGGGLFGRGGSSPRSGGSGGGVFGRGAAPRSAKGGTTPRGGSSSRRGGGGLLGRGSDATTSKRKNTPPGGGSSPKTGGSMPKNRWGGASGPTSRSTRGGRIRRGAARARDWADDKTGRRMSTGWKAARKAKGFKNRRRAAGQAVRGAGGGGIIAGVVGLIVAAFAGLASLFGWSGKDKEPKKDTTEGPAEKSAEGVADEKTTATGSGSAGPDVRADESRVAPPETPEPTTRSTEASTTPTGGTTMSRMPATPIAHDMASSMARYEPHNAWEALRNAREWPGVIEQVGWTVRNYAQGLENARFPFDPVIGEKLLEMYKALEGAYRMAEGLEPLIRKVHATDIARQDQRRGDESKWNV